MSACDTCRSPGSCCSGFVLSKSFEAHRWKAHARHEMKIRSLPFYPVRIYEGNHERDEDGRVFVQFDCRWLGDDGRCTNYNKRPETCHHYEPLQDYLCAMHVPLFKGVPIVVIA